MCLISSRHESACTDRDITCYKLVYPANMDDKFRSQFQEFPYELGRAYQEEYFREVNATRHVYEGFHSYRTVKEATMHSCPGMVLIKCVIPKGSRYFVSEENDQYCSNKIRVVAWRGVWRGKWREKPENNLKKIYE